MSALTLYFCGEQPRKFDDTDSHYWDGPLLPTLAAHDAGQPFIDWIWVDGPGSGSLFSDNKWEENARLLPCKDNGWQSNIQQLLHMIKGTPGWQRKKLTQAEFQVLQAAGLPAEDVRVPGSFLWRMFDWCEQDTVHTPAFNLPGRLPERVNLVGWSRGGISCHKLANAMLADRQLQHIPVFIFAVDPVPGEFHFQSAHIALGENVKEYVAFYARDERSAGFSCVIPHTHESTSVHIFPLPGRHETLAGNAGYDGVSSGKLFYEPGMIVRHFAQTCLLRWGVNVTHQRKLSDDQLLLLHKNLARNDDDYRKMRRYSYTLQTEEDQGERYVAWGSTGLPFSAICGHPFHPEAGLTGSYLGDLTLYNPLHP